MIVNAATVRTFLVVTHSTFLERYPLGTDTNAPATATDELMGAAAEAFADAAAAVAQSRTQDQRTTQRSA